MKKSAFTAHLTSLVFYIIGAVIYGYVLIKHIFTSLNEINATPDGGYELVPSFANIGSVAIHIITVAVLAIAAVAALILLIRKKSSVVTLASSILMLAVAAILASSTNLQEFMFARYTLGLSVGESRIYTVIKYVPFALSSVAAVISFVLDRTEKVNRNQ